MRHGQPVEIEVDSFPGVKLTGHVDSLSPASGLEFALLPPDNATGNFTKIVQRIPVKIVLDDSALAGLLRARHVGRADHRHQGDVEPAAAKRDRHPANRDSAAGQCRARGDLQARLRSFSRRIIDAPRPHSLRITAEFTP